MGGAMLITEWIIDKYLMFGLERFISSLENDN